MQEKVKTGKRALIDKANTNMMIVIAIASFVVTFSLIACKSLLSQSGYQMRVAKAKNTALKQLRTNNKNTTDLVKSYETFADSPVNLINGNPKGTGPIDGVNPSLVLDALPSKYDFPGLISSLEKVMQSGGYTINALGGNDDELAQQEASKGTPAPVEMPIPIGVSTNYLGTQKLLSTLEHSIRPFYVDQMTIVAGSNGELRLTVAAKTFYQPEKKMEIGEQVVK